MPTLRQPIKEQPFTAISPCLDSGLRRNDEAQQHTKQSNHPLIPTLCLNTKIICQNTNRTKSKKQKAKSKKQKAMHCMAF